MGRRAKAPPPKPFADAFPGIDKLEIAVIAKTVDARFKPMELVRWLLPDDVVDKLQAAFPYTRDADRTSHWVETLTLPVVFPAVACQFTIKVKSAEIKMLVPERTIARHDETRGEPILATLRHVHAQHTQFEKVRKVVRWLNEYATVGAARHYCPWMTGILPHDHPFQAAAGQVFREPRMSMVGIAGTMRECGAIMASALLCGDLDHVPTTSLVHVAFSGDRDPCDGGSPDEYTSNAFGLL